MPQLQIPMTIWLGSTPEERDGFYLAAGFDPNIPVIDNGTDNSTVRFRQDAAPVSGSFPAALQSGADFMAPVSPSLLGPAAGDDLRDFQAVGLTPFAEFGNGTPPPATGTALALAGRALKLIMGGGGGRLLAATWNSLPAVARSALTQVGIGVGALIAFNGDIPFITLPGQGNDMVPFIGPPEKTIDILGVGAHLPIGPPMTGVHIVGSWNTNPNNPSLGVTFYRLSDGKLAVQNKKGRWKVWKPKRPIVLYADGASNIKTMLRADKALAKQAKKIAAMLNRRAPKRAKVSKPSTPGIIAVQGGKVIDV